MPAAPRAGRCARERAEAALGVRDARRRRHVVSRVIARRTGGTAVAVQPNVTRGVMTIGTRPTRTVVGGSDTSGTTAVSKAHAGRPPKLGSAVPRTEPETLNRAASSFPACQRADSSTVSLSF